VDSVSSGPWVAPPSRGLLWGKGRLLSPTVALNPSEALWTEKVVGGQGESRQGTGSPGPEQGFLMHGELSSSQSPEAASHSGLRFVTAKSTKGKATWAKSGGGRHLTPQLGNR
jgi:hypothetical protein